MNHYYKAERWAVFVALSCALTLASCAQSLRTQIGLAVAASNDYTVRTTALLRADLITADEAQARLNQILAARDALHAASLALEACGSDTQCSGAQSRTVQVQSDLANLEAFLLTREKARRP